MKRVIRAFPYQSSTLNNATNNRIYTRFHRKPQIYPTSLRTNRTIKAENFEQESMKNLITKINKEKKYRCIFDPAAPNNKNIFIDSDSEHQNSEREDSGTLHHSSNRKSTKLLISKTESQFPETYNSLNIFRKDGLVKGYFVKVNERKSQIKNKYTTYDTFTKRSKIEKVIVESSTPEHDYNYNQEIQTQRRTNKINNYQEYNRNTVQKEIFKKEIDLDEWPSVEKREQKVYFRNKDIQIGDNMKIDNSNLIENQNKNSNQYQNQVKKFPAGMIYKKGNISEVKISYSKSNISDISEDFKNQTKKQIENNNFIIAGNASEIASPKDPKNNNDIAASSEEESDRKAEMLIYKDEEDQYNKNKRLIRQEVLIKDNFNNKRDLDNNILKDYGGKVSLYYGIINNNRDNRIQNQKEISNQKINITIEEEIGNDEYKLNSLIKLQRFIRSYLYLREICAMKIQAIWRGRNTRRIMDLYNDLDEFIYHLSRVQFNHFNSDFCFFIKQLFNVYKTNLSNQNFNEYDDDTDNRLNNEEEENDNENCMNQKTLEEMEQQKENNEYMFKFPEGSYFNQEKLIPENEIYLYVEGSSQGEYDKLIKDYEDLYRQYNELRQKNNLNINCNIHTVHRKEKNESESTIGSIKSDYRFKFGSNSRDNTNNKDYSEKRHSTGDKGKNITISNDDYDADLDINRDDDFFNQDMSYDDKDNSGSLKDKRYSYFSIHSDENSKYFDNENPKDRDKENKEGDNYKINTSKISGGSKFNNSSKYTGCSSVQGKSKLVRLHRFDKNNKNEFSNSPSIEKSNNYMGHHSKSFPRKYNYNDLINNNLIIIKHEEDFGIINKNLFLSPKEREENKHKKNLPVDIALTPIDAANNKYDDGKWNDVNKIFRNEEILISTQKNIGFKDKKQTKENATEITNELYIYENEPISNEQFLLEKINKNIEPYVLQNKVANVNIIKNKIYKKPRKLMIRKNEQINIIGIEKPIIVERKFDILELEEINEIMIDNEDYIKKKMEQIYIEHENELNIGVNKKIISEKNSLLKEIERITNENSLLKKQLEEMMNKLNEPKSFDSKLEINNNLNTLSIKGIETKPQIKEMLINKITFPEYDSNIENINQNISLTEIDNELNLLKDYKLKKEKEWNNLIINRVKTIELNKNEITEMKSLDSLIKSNENLNEFIESKIKNEKDKERNNLVINRTQKIEIIPKENVEIKTLDSLIKSENIEQNSPKEKEFTNLVINKNEIIELTPIKNIELNTLDKFINSNENLNTLKEDKLRNEKEWNNLVINEIEKIELKPEIKESKEEQVEENKKIIIVKEFDILDIESFRIFIGEKGKPQRIINSDIESELVIKKVSKGQKETEKDKNIINEQAPIEETQLQSPSLRSLYKKQLPKKENIKKVEKKENIEETLPEKKRLYTELQPVVQTNIRFSYHLKHKKEEKPENVKEELKWIFLLYLKMMELI